MKRIQLHNRRGVTLLFVISMILLFLLMGTAFVVVANDFARSSKVRGQLTIKSINSLGEFQGDRLLNRAFYDLLRGPDLDNSNSPLRAHSILADMYGYGLAGYVKNIDASLKEFPSTTDTTTPHFFKLELVGSSKNINDDTVTFDDFLNPNDGRIFANNILDGKPIYTAVPSALLPPPDSTEFLDFDLVPSTPGNLNGQLLSIVSGPANGLTTRIIDHQIFPIADSNFLNSIRYEHSFVVAIENSAAGIDLSNLPGLITTLDDLLNANPNNAIPTRVLINGRAFAGTGAGAFDPESTTTTAAIARYPENQVGKTRDELISLENDQGNVGGSGGGSRFEGVLSRIAKVPTNGNRNFLRSNNYATNEPYDAVDGNNMFLSGTTITYPAAQPGSARGSADEPAIQVFPSFGRQSLVSDDLTMSDRPNTTTNSSFKPTETSKGYMEENVDLDGDGQEDSILIDPGYPTFVHTDGTKIKPLVAYHVVDLDSKININIHGNRSQIPDYGRFSMNEFDIAYDNSFPVYGTNGSFVFAQGSGFGPSEIRLDTTFQENWIPDSADGDGVMRREADRLIIGDLDANNVVRLSGRYGNEFNDMALNSGGGPVPGFVNLNGDQWLEFEPFAAYGFFGFPVTDQNGTNPGGILGGNFQSSPLDIYGRHRTGFPEFVSETVQPGDPNANFTTSMPIIDVVTTLAHTEIFNNPYEVDYFRNINRVTNPDTLFSLQELEQIYRQGDPDITASEFGIEPTGAELLNFSFTVEQERAIRLKVLAPSLDRNIAQRDNNSATPERFTNDRNYLSFTTESWEVPTLVQEYIAGSQIVGDVNVGDLSSGLQTLAGKLYTILSTEGDTNFGFRLLNPPSDSDGGDERAQRERMIMAQLTGYMPNAGDSRTYDVANNSIQWRAMLSNDIRAGLPFDINRPFGNGRDDDMDGTFDEDDESNDFLRHPEDNFSASGENAFDYDNNGLDDGNGTNNQIFFNRQLYARHLYVLTLLATEFVDRNGNGNLFDDFVFNGATDQAAREAYRAMIAQWAINVVDFRDPDSIMTPFEYDLNPFDGWDVDGVIDGTDPVVWGVERPDLLITETLALHDRRVQDTADDPSMEMNPLDAFPDSRMVPIASAFFELYNPWIQTGDISNPGTDQIPAAELDNTTATLDRGVNITQLAGNDPVWRMVVVPGLQDSAPSGLSVQFNPSIDPDNRNPSAMPLPPDHRYIYFNTPSNSSLTAESIDDTNTVYVSTITKDQVVFPGNYAVIGSAGIDFNNSNTTFLGRRTEYDDSDEITVPDASDLRLADSRRIELDPGNNEVRVYNSASGTAPQLRSTNVAVLPIHGPISLGEANRRSLGLSDPYLGYEGLVNDQPGDTGVPLSVMEGDDGPYFVDDSGARATAQLSADQQAANIDSSLPDGNGHVGDAATKNGVHSSQFVVLLQRLSDPTRAFNVFTNPYRTIDSSATDLIVYNGMPPAPETSLGGLTPDPLHFGSFERRSNIENNDLGQEDVNDAMSTNRFRMLWKTDYAGLNPTAPSAVVADPASHFFNQDLVHSLGQLNVAWGNQVSVPTSGTENNAAEINPFPWMTWNNRPFTSPFELTLVPFTSSYFLTNRFDISMTSAGWRNSPFQPHSDTMAGDAMSDEAAAVRGSLVSGDFPHLLNFHMDDETAMPLLHRIFDHVEVPSPYVGTKRYLNPDGFDGTAGPTTQLTRAFRPPFDYLSSFRYPGKININTISDFRTWNALMGDYATRLPDDLNDTNNLQDESFTAFQAAGAGEYRPHTGSNNTSMNTRSADAGLFRRDAANPNTAFFDYNITNPTMEDPLNFVGRNAYFKYHKRNRLGNLVTNRSSVFAIWIEIRYFEVTNIQNEATAVAGTEVIGERFMDAGSDRGFFIVDRSIPVAFEPGKNHNVDQAVKVSSFIE